MNGLPTGWTWAQLSQVCTSITDGDHQAPPQVPEGIPFLVIGNIRTQALDFTGCRHVPPEYFRSLNPIRRPQKGDVLYSLVGSYGISVLVRDDTPFCVQRHIGILRPSREISSSFLALLLSSRTIFNQATEYATGTAQMTVPLSGLRRIRIPLPPRPEQERIVAAIEEQFSRLDAGVAALERARQNLRNLRAAVLQAAVTGRLLDQDPAEGTGTDLLTRISKRRSGARPPAIASAGLAVPETWAVASLEAVTDPNRVICYGILKPKVREGGTIPYVEVKDLRASRLDVAALHRTSAALHSEFSRSVLSSDDVVLAIRGSYDRALVVPPEVAGANMSRDVARIAPLPGIEASFVAAYLMSPPALQYLHERARGVAVKGVNIADVRTMPVPVPPVAEQRRIVSEIDRVNSIIEELESTLASGRVRGAALRSSILAAAFSGNLASQDPADEPALRLLQRIGAEGASSDGHKVGRGRKPRVLQEGVTA